MTLNVIGLVADIEYNCAMKIYVVISLFNERKHIDGVLGDVSGYKLPIVVVDDGSTDRSRFKIHELGFKNLTILKHKVNLGKGAAMKTGCDFAFGQGADAVIFMDSDGQHMANDLPKFINSLKSGKYEVILGSRNYNYGVPLVRYLGNKFASLLMAFLFHIYVSDVICGFRAITKGGYKKILWDSDGYGVETEMVARIGKQHLRFCEIPVETIYHNKVKGVTLLDAIGIFIQVLKWRLTI
jgi:glycosyltransferase involved in cell wall biosynthesis